VRQDGALEAPAVPDLGYLPRAVRGEEYARQEAFNRLSIGRIASARQKALPHVRRPELILDAFLVSLKRRALQNVRLVQFLDELFDLVAVKETPCPTHIGRLNVNDGV